MTHAEMWGAAANDLQFCIVAPFTLTLPSGAAVEAEVLVIGFGASNGMLVFSEPAVIKEHGDEIVSSGYGYSVFDPPGAHEEYDRDDYVEMLSDWGWSGTPESKPSWLRPENERGGLGSELEQ